MTARGGIANRQHDAALSLIARLERAAGDARQLVAGRQPDLDGPRLTLHHGDVDERHHPDVRVAKRDERHDVGERAHLARRGHGRAVAHRPPHVSGRARSKRHLDGGSPVGRGSFGDQTGGHVDVGLIAGQIDRRARGSGGRHRQRERRAPRREGERRTPFERQGEGAGAGQESRVHDAVRAERQRPARCAPFDQGRARDQRHTIDARPQNVTQQAEHALHGFAIDADAQVGACEHGANRRGRETLRRPIRQIRQAVVFTKGQGDASRRIVSRNLGRPHGRLGFGGVRESQKRDRHTRDIEGAHVLIS